MSLWVVDKGITLNGTVLGTAEVTVLANKGVAPRLQ